MSYRPEIKFRRGAVVSMKKIILSIFAAAVIVSLIWASFFGFELGFSRASQAERNQSASSNVTQSQPDTYDPYTFVFDFQGNKTTAYVPIIFLAPGFNSQIYVTYGCSGGCFLGENVSTYKVGSISPLILRVEENGSETNSTSAIFLSSPSVLQENSNEETVAYALSSILVTNASAAYYSFIFPYTCDLQPILYVGNNATNLDFTLIKNWLAQRQGVSQTCPFLELDVSVLGFTNTYYNRLTVQYNTTTTTGAQQSNQE